MKKLILITLAIISGIACFSQQLTRCGTTLLTSQRALENPSYEEFLSDLYSDISAHSRSDISQRSDEIFRIPVVVHVIYNNDLQNIPDELVYDQIATLNRDYRRLNSDTVLTRAVFAPVAGDTRIEFFLAERDPQGIATNGITRTHTDRESFIDFSFDLNLMKSAATGGADAWATDKYLNIWVCNMAIPIINLPFILGFATPPDGSPDWPAGSGAAIPEQDGVVIHYEVFGSHPDATGALVATNRGRTATHEIGHYLGLRHIWGDGQGADVCVVDDGIEDTPKAAAANQQTCDYQVNSCDEGSGDLPDMLENYMDYSDENCLNMFTKQQVEAMRYVLENFRQDLLIASFPESIPESKLKLYPNPATNFINLYSAKAMAITFTYSIFQADGRCIGKGILTSDNIDVSSLAKGLYTLMIEDSGHQQSWRFIRN